MKYSVYNWKTGRFDYFEDGSKHTMGAVPTRRKRFSRKGYNEGLAPEEIATVLPANSKHVGSGEKAIGRIAVSGVDAAPDKPNYLLYGTIAAAVYLLYRVFK